MVRFTANLRDFHSRKALLIQSKLRRSPKLGKAAYKDLRKQCRRMVNATPSSYAFIYTQDGIDVRSASSVIASETEYVLQRSHGFGLETLLSDFFLCWIGDPREAFFSENNIRGMLDGMQAQNLLDISFTQVDGY